MQAGDEEERGTLAPGCGTGVVAERLVSRAKGGAASEGQQPAGRRNGTQRSRLGVPADCPGNGGRLHSGAFLARVRRPRPRHLTPGVGTLPAIVERPVSQETDLP